MRATHSQASTVANAVSSVSSVTESSPFPCVGPATHSTALYQRLCPRLSLCRCFPVPFLVSHPLIPLALRTSAQTSPKQQNAAPSRYKGHAPNISSSAESDRTCCIAFFTMWRKTIHSTRGPRHCAPKFLSVRNSWPENLWIL